MYAFVTLNNLLSPSSHPIKALQYSATGDSLLVVSGTAQVVFFKSKAYSILSNNDFYIYENSYACVL